MGLYLILIGFPFIIVHFFFITAHKHFGSTTHITQPSGRIVPVVSNEITAQHACDASCVTGVWHATTYYHLSSAKTYHSLPPKHVQSTYSLEYVCLVSLSKVLQ